VTKQRLFRIQLTADMFEGAYCRIC